MTARLSELYHKYMWIHIPSDIPQFFKMEERLATVAEEGTCLFVE